MTAEQRARHTGESRSRGFVHGLTALAVLVASLSGACENPLAPEPCGSIPEQTVVEVGLSIRVLVCFKDENGDWASLSSKSSDQRVATVRTLGSGVTVTGVGPGTAKVTVIARAPGGPSETVSFSVTVLMIRQLTYDFGGAWGPAWSPDGTRIAFVSGRHTGLGAFLNEGEIYVVNLDGSGETRLTRSGGTSDGPTWSPDGSRIMFWSDGEIHVMEADGSDAINLTKNAGLDGYPAWSPDGSRFAFTSGRDGNAEIYVMNADGSGATNLTNNAADDWNPVWSPDSRRIAFISSRNAGIADIYLMNADGSGQANLTYSHASDSHPAWSPDGTRIAFTASPRFYDSEVYVINTDGSGETNLTNHAADDAGPVWSPDGSRIAFVSDRAGGAGGGLVGQRPGELIALLHVMNADGSAATNLTNDLVWSFAWSPDGRQIAFTSDGTAQIHVMRIPFAPPPAPTP